MNFGHFPIYFNGEINLSYLEKKLITRVEVYCENKINSEMKQDSFKQIASKSLPLNFTFNFNFTLK